MRTEQLLPLAFKRQYLLVPREIDCPFLHNTRQVTAKYTLYTHPDLVVTDITAAEKRLILLGDMFDFEDPRKDNKGILNDLSVVSFDAMLAIIGRYSGRFVLIQIEQDQIIMLHDSTAARKVFFSTRKGDPWFSSQQHLLAKVMGFSKTTDPSKLEFYESSDFIRLNNSNLGNTTYYDEVEQLMPNHYYDVKSNGIIRYWPSERFKKLSFREVAERCTVMIKGYMESIANRCEIMLPITGGGDSRLLMAGTRNFKEKVLYYINKDEKLSDDDPDITTPRKLFSYLGMDFNVVALPPEIDPSFEKVYFENNPIASKFYLPHIYNYYLNYPDKVNLPGNISSTPWAVYHMNRKTVTIEDLTRYYNVYRFDYVKDYYQKWMDNCNELCKACNMNVINLYYWEERISNWGNQTSIDKDIAQEDFNPFNSRLLNELFLSLPLKYNNEPDKKVHVSIIRSLWPELMKLPFNPSFSTSVQMFLAYLGLYTPIQRINYRLFQKKANE